MLPVLRIHHALILATSLGFALTPALLTSGCGPTGVAIEACRKIESARCDAAASCGFSKDQVDNCKLEYQDQCLHGIENSALRPSETQVNACVDAVKATRACADSKIATMADCTAAPVVNDAAAAKAPCDIVLGSAESLSACAFAVAPADAGTTTTSSTTSSGGGGTGGTTSSGGGGTGGTGATSVGGSTK